MYISARIARIASMMKFFRSLRSPLPSRFSTATRSTRGVMLLSYGSTPPSSERSAVIIAAGLTCSARPVERAMFADGALALASLASRGCRLRCAAARVDSGGCAELSLNASVVSWPKEPFL